jgi:capsular polysaccharide transport system permease protein
MREMLTRYGSSKLGYFWAFTTPLMTIALMGFMYAYLKNHNDPKFIPYLITGFVPYLLFTNAMSRTMSAIDSNKGLLTFPILKIEDIVWGRIILEIYTFVPIFFMCITFSHYYIYKEPIKDPLFLLYNLFLLGGLGFGIGLIASAILPFFAFVKTIINVASRFLVFFSGVIIPLHVTPHDFKYYQSFLPLAHPIENIRATMLTDYAELPLFMDDYYVIKWIIITTIIGFAGINMAKTTIQR